MSENLKKICCSDRRNGRIQWNTHIKYKTKHKRKYMAGLWIWTQDPCITGKVLYNFDIQANHSRLNYKHSSLTKCLLSKKHTANNVQPARTYWFNKCLITDGHSFKCNRKERKYRNKLFFYKEERKCLKVWKVLRWFF